MRSQLFFLSRAGNNRLGKAARHKIHNHHPAGSADAILRHAHHNTSTPHLPTWQEGMQAHGRAPPSHKHSDHPTSTFSWESLYGSLLPSSSHGRGMCHRHTRHGVPICNRQRIQYVHVWSQVVVTICRILLMSHIIGPLVMATVLFQCMQKFVACGGISHRIFTEDNRVMLHQSSFLQEGSHTT